MTSPYIHTASRQDASLSNECMCSCVHPHIHTKMKPMDMHIYPFVQEEPSILKLLVMNLDHNVKLCRVCIPIQYKPQTVLYCRSRVHAQMHTCSILSKSHFTQIPKCASETTPCDKIQQRLSSMVF